MSELLRCHYGVDVKAGPTEDRTVSVIASTDSVDLEGEVLVQDWSLERYLRNPVVLYFHNLAANDVEDTLPIGFASDVGVLDGKLRATLHFVDEKASALAERCYQGFLQGSLRAVSVGFKSKLGRVESREGSDVFVLTGNVLLEISVCPVGINGDAVADGRAKSLALRALVKAADIPTAPPPAPPVVVEVSPSTPPLLVEEPSIVEPPATALDPPAEPDVLTDGAPNPAALDLPAQPPATEATPDEPIKAPAFIPDPPRPAAKPAEEDPMLNPPLLALLGLSTSASEKELTDELSGLKSRADRGRDAERTVLASTGAETIEKAIGIIAGWKAGAEQVTGLKARVTELETAEEAHARAAIFAEHPTKFTPALRKWAEKQPLESLKGFVTSAPEIPALAARGAAGEKAAASHDTAPDVDPHIDTSAAGKTWEQLSAAEKHNLHFGNKALYDALKAEHERRSGRRLGDGSG